MVKQGSDLTFGSVVKHQTHPGWLLKFLCVREIYISVLGNGHIYQKQITYLSTLSKEGSKFTIKREERAVVGSSEYTQGALPLGPPLKASGRMKRVWGSEL